MADIKPDEGRLITVKALGWKGTEYALVGDKSVKGVSGDCSGTTNKIYCEAGFTYQYRSTDTFAAYAYSSGLFRLVADGEPKQDGDILLWDDHMAIYSSFSSPLEGPFRTTPRTNKAGKPWTQFNDMWTASHTDGPPYGPGASKFWKSDAPDVYRFVRGKAP
jgi:hypothetical protein